MKQEPSRLSHSDASFLAVAGLCMTTECTGDMNRWRSREKITYRWCNGYMSVRGEICGMNRVVHETAGCVGGQEWVVLLGKSHKDGGK